MSKCDVDDLVKEWVTDRYTKGAEERQAALCCPVTYQGTDLSFLPDEIVEKDYGCGDPLRYVREGDTVLDLGSGSGKACYLAAKKVGPSGSVIGVDMNDSMLALARKYQNEMADYLGGHRVDFRKGHIEDLQTDVTALHAYLAEYPVCDAASFDALQRFQYEQRLTSPLVVSDTVDLVVSNCVLNLVSESARQNLMEEIYRILKPGGRVAISDIVVDRHVPDSMKQDPELWSGCLSGAFQEQALLDAFSSVGFEAVAYDQWSEQPWQVIEGYSFRSVTLNAIKPSSSQGVSEGASEAGMVTVMYRGPYQCVTTDLGETFIRGERVDVLRSRAQSLVGCGDEVLGYGAHFVLIDDAATCSSNRKPAKGCCG